MEIKTLTYLDNEGKLSSECKHTIPDADLIKGYETMFVTRLVDDRMITIQRQGIISTPCSRQFASDGIAPKGEGYGMLTFRVDGNDFFAVHEVVSKAKGYCLEGKGPVLIEAMTYRAELTGLSASVILECLVVKACG